MCDIEKRLTQNKLFSEALPCHTHRGGGWGGGVTLIFAYIRRLGSLF